MTETRTARFELPQWSDKINDGPEMDDFNEAFLNLSTQAAMDRHTPTSALPSSGVLPAELFQRTATVGGATLRSLYRSDAGTTWRAYNWVPETLRVRPADTTAATAEAFRVDHPDNTPPALATTWDGQASIRRSLTLGGSADTSLGRLTVGGLDAIPADTRARITGYGAERVLELRAGDGSVTELLRMVDSAGSSVLTVSGAGSLTSTQASAFGGTSPGAASITGAPQPTGAQITGILAHGLEAATGRAALQVNRYGPGSSDPAAVLAVLPSSITIGRTGAWVGGSITVGAPAITVMSPQLAWYPTVGEIGGGVGVATAGMAAGTGLYSTIGTQLSNAGVPAASANNLFSWPSSAANWTGQLFRAFQAEVVGGSTETTEVSRLDAVGRLLLNAPWRGSGSRPAELRDARQAIAHYCNRVWAQPGTYEAGPQVLGGGSPYVYTWPTMTIRSASAAQLEIQQRLEAQYFRNTGSDTPIERQTMQMQWDISINGGAWTYVTQNQTSNDLTSVQEQGALVSGSYDDSALTQDSWTIPILTTLAAGSAFQLRFRVQVATGSNVSDSIAPAYVRLRRADLYVRESIIQSYSATS